MVPTRNDLDKAKKAIHSVAEQTFEVKKCIVVDDGSETEVTLDDFAHITDIDIHIIRTSGVGLAAARNVGLAQTKSEYIAFLDADDYWLPDKLSNQIRVLETRKDIVGVCSGYFLIRPNGEVVKKVLPKKRKLTLKRILSESVTLTGSASSLLMRRNVIDSLNGFNESLDYAEDMDMWLRMSKIGPFIAVRKADVIISANPESMQRRLSEIERARKETFVKFRILEQFAKEGNDVRRQVIKSWAKIISIDKGEFSTIRRLASEENKSAIVKNIKRKPVSSCFIFLSALGLIKIIHLKQKFELRIKEAKKEINHEI